MGLDLQAVRVSDSQGHRLVLDYVERWSSDLVELSRRNRLLYFKHTKSASLEFAQTAPEVIERLGRHRWAFHLPPEVDEDQLQATVERPELGELVVEMVPARFGPQIYRNLKLLAGNANSGFLDTGIWTLFLGLGQLCWTDVEGIDAVSPLYLFPVALEQDGPGSPWSLKESLNAEPAINPSLAVKLERDFGIILPRLDDMEEPDLAHVLEGVRSAVSDTDWTVNERTVLSTFTFQKDVIYRDMRANADAISGHGLVRLLAEGPTSEVADSAQFGLEDEDTLDVTHPPEDLLLVLDADVRSVSARWPPRPARASSWTGRPVPANPRPSPT